MGSISQMLYIAFMSDTVNEMKRTWSGIQKLIRDVNSSLYDVGCICHLANLIIKAGLRELLPIDCLLNFLLFSS